MLGDGLRDIAVRIVQVAEQHRAASFLGAGFDTGRQARAIQTVDAKRTAFDRALAARRPRLLIPQRLVNEGAGLVGTGHHAEATADADMLVDENDTVRALERGSRRTNVDAGRLVAMLAHHRHFAIRARPQIVQLDLSNPLRVDLRPVAFVPTVLVAA